MKIGQYFTPPTQTILNALTIGSAPQNWLIHLEPSLSWLHLFSRSQEQCVRHLVRFKPELCGGQLYGEYLNQLTQVNPVVNEETNVSETHKSQILKNVKLKSKNAHNNPKTNSQQFQSKRFMKNNTEATDTAKDKTSKAIHLPKSLKQVMTDSKLHQLAGRQNFQSTLATHKTHQQYFINMNPKAGADSLNTGLKYSNKTPRLQLKGQVNTDNWIQRIVNRVTNTLGNNKQKHDIATLISTDKRKFTPFIFDENDKRKLLQNITDGQRAPYKLLALNSDLFENESAAFSSSNADMQTSEGNNAVQVMTSSDPQTREEKSFFQNIHDQDLKTELFKQQPVLQNAIEPQHILNRLTATAEDSSQFPLPTKAKQISTNAERQELVINHQKVHGVDDELPELATKVKRILDEEARRYGIDV